MAPSNPQTRMKENLTIDPSTPISERRNPVKQSAFRSFLQKFYPSKPASEVSSQALETFKFDDLNFQTEKGKKMLYTILRRYGLVFRSVKLKSAFAVPSIDFKFNNKKEKDVVEMFLNNLHPASGLLQLTTFLRDIYADTTAWGTGFLDPIWDKKKTMITGLKKIHPMSMDLIRENGFGEGGEVKLDKNDNPIGWIQRINDKKSKELTFEQVAYLTFNTFGDEWLGMSDLEPIYQTTWRLMNIEEGVATAIFRHGFPLYDVQVAGGQDGRPPTKEQLEKAAEEVAGLNYKSEFIHPPNYKVSLLESFSIGKSRDYMDPFIDQIAAASDIPKFILLGGSADIKTNAKELLKTIRPALNPSREKLKLFFEEQVLKPLMEANHISTTPELIIGNVLLLDAEIEARIEQEKIEEAERKAAEEKGEKKTPEENLRETNKLAKENKELDRQRKIKAEAKEKLKKRKEDLESEEISTTKIDKKGKYLTLSNPHGRMLMTGEKKQLAFSAKDEKAMKKLIGKEINIYEGSLKFGQIKLREPRKVNLNEFIDLEYAHMVEGEEREERWPGETEFLLYEFDKMIELEEPQSLEENSTNSKTKEKGKK